MLKNKKVSKFDIKRLHMVAKVKVLKDENLRHETSFILKVLKKTLNSHLVQNSGW